MLEVYAPFAEFSEKFYIRDKAKPDEILFQTENLSLAMFVQEMSEELEKAQNFFTEREVWEIGCLVSDKLKKSITAEEKQVWGSIMDKLKKLDKDYSASKLT